MAESAHGHHIIPIRTYFMVFGGLIFLTAITVLAAYVDMGALNVPVALAIAAVKATLVVLFFMALKYDNPVNAMVFGVGILFVAVFLVFTLLDTELRGVFDETKGIPITDQEQVENQD